MPVFVCVHHTRTSRARQSANDIAAQFAWAPSEAWGQGGWLGGLRGPTPWAREHAHDRWGTHRHTCRPVRTSCWSRALSSSAWRAFSPTSTIPTTLTRQGCLRALIAVRARWSTGPAAGGSSRCSPMR